MEQQGSRFSISRKTVFAIAISAALPIAAHAQFPEAPSVPASMINSPALKPPAGANVAIVEFDDLECPACAASNPTLMEAAKKYKVPWIRHDFLIPGHVWSAQAAVNARWFDEKSKDVGAAYRNEIFAEQQSIATRDDLNQATQKFAQAHGIQMPFVMDPQGKLASEVRADVDLAHALGLHRTPTIFVVTAHSHDAGHREQRCLHALHLSRPGHVRDLGRRGAQRPRAPLEPVASKPVH